AGALDLDLRVSARDAFVLDADPRVVGAADDDRARLEAEDAPERAPGDRRQRGHLAVRRARLGIAEVGDRELGGSVIRVLRGYRAALVRHDPRPLEYTP